MESITPHDLLYVKLEDLIHLNDIPDWFDEKMTGIGSLSDELLYLMRQFQLVLEETNEVNVTAVS